MIKWIVLLATFACSSAFAQTAPPNPIAVIRAQILQHWFPAPQVKLDFTVSFDLDRDGRLIGEPVIVAKGHSGDSALEMNYAVKLAQPFFLLRPEDYESWKHVTTNFTQADKRSTDIYAFTKKDILGVFDRHDRRCGEGRDERKRMSGIVDKIDEFGMHD
jgi:hypothetical protein